MNRFQSIHRVPQMRSVVTWIPSSRYGHFQGVLSIWSYATMMTTLGILPSCLSLPTRVSLITLKPVTTIAIIWQHVTLPPLQVETWYSTLTLLIPTFLLAPTSSPVTIYTTTAQSLTTI